jgi:hypothetical protein
LLAEVEVLQDNRRSVDILAGKHPEDIPGRSVIKFRAAAPSIAQRNDHAFLPL